MAKDTKEKVLDAAELLFSKQGIGTTSIRAIITKADVNIASIHYHFGCKHELIKAVYYRRLNPINEKRQELLEELESAAGDKDISVTDIVKAFLSPVIEQFSSSRKFQIIKGLLARVHSEPNEVVHLKSIFDETFKRFFNLFSQTLPHLSKEELMSRFTFMIGAMGIAFLDDHIVHKKEQEKNLNISYESKGKHIIQFVSAGFEAPAAI